MLHANMYMLFCLRLHEHNALNGESVSSVKNDSWFFVQKGKFLLKSGWHSSGDKIFKSIGLI